MSDTNVKMEIINSEKYKRANIRFTGIPDEKIREELKREGWFYSRNHNVWYPKNDAADNSQNFAHYIQQTYFNIQQGYVEIISENTKAVTPPTNELLKEELKFVLNEKAQKLETVEYSRENYDKLFPFGIIETPVETVKLGERQFSKLELKDRERLLFAAYQTLKTPDIVFNEERENADSKEIEKSHNYVKSFIFDTNTKAIQDIVVSIDGKNISISSHPREINNVVNKIKNPDQLIFISVEIGNLLKQRELINNEQVIVEPTMEKLIHPLNEKYNEKEVLSISDFVVAVGVAPTIQTLRTRASSTALRASTTTVDSNISQTKEKPTELTPEDIELCKKVIPPAQFKFTMELTEGEEGEFFKNKMKEIADTYRKINTDSELTNEDGTHNVGFRYFLGDTEIFLSEIDSDGIGFGYNILNGDLQMSEWGSTSLEEIMKIPYIEMDYHVPEGITIERMLYQEHPEYFSEYAPKEEKKISKTELRFNNEEFEQENVIGKEASFRYKLLSRMQQDCEYYLGNGNRNPKHLWALKEVEHIKNMVSLYNSFSFEDKPEWLTIEQLDNFSKELTGKSLEENGWMDTINENNVFQELSLGKNNADSYTNEILDKIRAAGIEVVTDKDEFDRILEQEEQLQKMVDSVESIESLFNTNNNENLNSDIDSVTPNDINVKFAQINISQTTPFIFKECGLDEYPVNIYKQKLARAFFLEKEKFGERRTHGHKGEFTSQEVKEVFKNFGNPRYIFNSRYNISNTADFYLIGVYDTFDLNGEPMMVSLHFNKNEKEVEANWITSVYGKNKNILVDDWTKKGYLIYKNDLEIEKAPEEVVTLYMRVSKSSSAYEHNILLKSNIVNDMGIMYMKENNNTYGFVHNGKIYLNPDFMNSNAAVHEYTHLWDAYTQKTNPELWNKGLNLFKDTKYWNEVTSDPNYQDIKNDENLILSEIHSRICGDIAEKVLERIAELDGEQVKLDAIDWNKKVYFYIREEFELDDRYKSLNFGAENTTVFLTEFLSTPMKDLMASKNINVSKELSWEELAAMFQEQDSSTLGDFKTTKETVQKEETFETEKEYKDEVVLRRLDDILDFHAYNNDGTDVTDENGNPYSDKVLEEKYLILEQISAGIVDGKITSLDNAQIILNDKLLNSELYKKVSKKLEKEAELNRPAEPLKVYTFSPFGYEGTIVQVETDLRRGIPSYDIVGIPDSAVKETRERIRAAFRNSGIEMPAERMLQALNPADLRKDSPMDLAMAVGILNEQNHWTGEPVLALGELELSGRIHPVRGAVAAVNSAKAAGITNVVCDPVTAELLMDIDGIKILTAESLKEANEKLMDAESWTKKFTIEDEQRRQRNFIREKTQNTDSWMKTPAGEKTLLREQLWLDIQTPNFKRNFGNWNYDENQKVNIISLDTTDLPFDYENIQSLKQWLKTNLVGKSVEIDSDGQNVKFNSRTTRASIKRRGEEQRGAYSVLDDLIENSVYFDFEKTDEKNKHKHLKGQDIYYSALKVGEKLYSVKIKIDVSKDNLEGAYKDHKVAEINIAPNLYHSQSNDLYADIGANKISLAVLTDFVKPKKLMTLNALGEPFIEEIQDKIKTKNVISDGFTDKEKELFTSIFDVGNTPTVQFNEEWMEDYKEALENLPMAGHFETIRAIEIAVAGKHNILATGAPGSGKTLLTQTLMPALTPKLTEEEAKSITRINSLAGLDSPKRDKLVPPFRMPHQTATIEGICGGGPNCRPGEISLAHHGTLFMDETAEFRSSVIQMLRVPLESRQITMSRAGRSTSYPADFQLAMAMNPCPCGNFHSPDKICLDSARSIEQYWKKISDPLLDRVEIKQFVQKDESDTRTVTIEQMKTAISRAYEIQRKRGVYNSHLTPAEIQKYCTLDAESMDYLNKREEILTPRVKSNLLKTSLTIANMDGRELIQIQDIKEAMELVSPVFEKPRQFVLSQEQIAKAHSNEVHEEISAYNAERFSIPSKTVGEVELKYEREEKEVQKFKSDEQVFFNQLNNYLKNGIAPKGNNFVILKTPDIMQYADIPNNEIILSSRVINKARKIHGLTDKEIETALSQLANPILVFDSDSNTSESKLPSVLTFTNTFASEIKPVAISLNYDKEKKFSDKKIIINDITSIHDRNLEYINKETKEKENVIDKWTNKGLCRYVNDKKISDWQVSTRVQFSLEPYQSDKVNIKTYSDFVNRNIAVQSPMSDYITRHQAKWAKKEMQQQEFNFNDPGVNQDVISAAEKERDRILEPVLNGERTGMYKAFKDFEEKGVFDIKGTTVKLAKNGGLTPTGWKQLQAAMEIYRSKKFETFRYIMIDRKTGEIADQLAITSHMPNFCNVSKPNDETLKQVISRAEEKDYLIAVCHNHPSGNTTESLYDRELTDFLDRSLRRNDGLNRFAGHIILDHDTFNLAVPSEARAGNCHWKKMEPMKVTEIDPFTAEQKPEWAENYVGGTTALKEVAKKINDTENWNDDFIPVVFTNADRKISGVQYYSKNFFENESDKIRNEFQFAALEAGAIGAFPVITDSLWKKFGKGATDFEAVMKAHVMNDAFTDVAFNRTTITEKYNIEAGRNFYSDSRSLSDRKIDVAATWEPEINHHLFPAEGVGENETNWGDKREEAGRPATGAKTNSFTVTLDRELAQRIDMIASEKGISVNKVLKNLIIEGQYLTSDKAEIVQEKINLEHQNEKLNSLLYKKAVLDINGEKISAKEGLIKAFGEEVIKNRKLEAEIKELSSRTVQEKATDYNSNDFEFERD